MKSLIISLCLMILLSACASTPKAISLNTQTYAHFLYKVSSTGRTVDVGYIGMTEDYARKLLQDFESSGGSHRSVVESASKYKSHSLSLRAECSGECKYVVDSFVPCSGAVEHYFTLEEKIPDLKFNFVSEMQTMDDCCLSPGRSWFFRLFNL